MLRQGVDDGDEEIVVRNRFWTTRIRLDDVVGIAVERYRGGVGRVIAIERREAPSVQIDFTQRWALTAQGEDRLQAWRDELQTWLDAESRKISEHPAPE